MAGRKAGSRTSRKSRKSDSRAPLKGRRFTEEQRHHALLLVASGMKRTEVARVIGTTTESLRRWVKIAAEGNGVPRVPVNAEAEESVSKSDGSLPQEANRAPKDPGQGLGADETEAIISFKKRHPSMGPAQIRAQLKRFKGWRISLRAIARVLRDAGYETVHRGSRPEGPEPIRFEAPRPNALWQTDFAEFRLAGERLHVVLILDDFSRFVVGHGVGASPSSEVAIAALEAAIAHHGRPESIRSDRGGAFLSSEFTSFLESHLIDHIIGRAYRPQGGGKVESLVGTVRRELWDVEHFGDRDEAERRLADFVDHVNERRAHMGLDGLTPADRYFGRAKKVLALIDAVSRRRQMASARFAEDGAALEDLASPSTAAPLEILRLVVVGKELELRFCGHRLRLGRLEA